MCRIHLDCRISEYSTLSQTFDLFFSACSPNYINSAPSTKILAIPPKRPAAPASQFLFPANPTLFSPYLNVSVQTDSRKEDALQVLKGHRPLLVLIDGEGQGPPGEVEQDTDSGPFGDASFSPVKEEAKEVGI